MDTPDGNCKISGKKRKKDKKKPVLLESWTQGTANDSHIYAADLAIKTTQIDEIYPKLETFQVSSKKFQININWGKIKIIVDEHEYATDAMRKKLPNKYRGIQFVTTGTLLGQQINLQKKN